MGLYDSAERSGIVIPSHGDARRELGSAGQSRAGSPRTSRRVCLGPRKSGPEICAEGNCKAAQRAPPDGRGSRRKLLPGDWPTRLRFRFSPMQAAVFARMDVLKSPHKQTRYLRDNRERTPHVLIYCGISGGFRKRSITPRGIRELRFRPLMQKPAKRSATLASSCRRGKRRRRSAPRPAAVQKWRRRTAPSSI